jgi:hypothetical protein
MASLNLRVRIKSILIVACDHSSWLYAIQMNDFLSRAFYSYLHDCVRSKEPTVLPNSSLSAHESYNTKHFITLRDDGGAIVAVYRVRANGNLRRLARWPIPLERPPLSTGQLYKKLYGGLTRMNPGGKIIKEII